jgi:hypothetical protein
MAAIDELQRQLSAESFRISNLGTPTTALDATYTDNTTAPSNPAAAASAGASLVASPADHVHQAVHSLHADAAANLYGDVQLVSGSGITLSQAGNAITVAASGGSVNKITLGSDQQTSVVGTTEFIVAEYNINFDDAGAVGNIQARLSAIVKISAATGTFKLYTGATAPGATTGGTLRATCTTTSTTFEKQTNLGAAFTNPGGQQLVQITAVASAGGNKATIRGFQLAIG